MEISVGQEFWFVATGTNSQGSQNAELDTLVSAMKANPVLNPGARNKRASPEEVYFWVWELLDGNRSLKYDNFDNLIRLTDDLAKFDSQLDTIIHRLERQYIEFLPKAVFEVQTQGRRLSFEDYFKSWKWDEAKYPRSRTISDTFTYIQEASGKLDEQCRTKTAQLNEMKNQSTNLAMKDGQLLTNRDLVDVLTPEVVTMSVGGNCSTDDFIYTEHFTTVIVILPKGAEKEFLDEYVNFVPEMEGIPMIVPTSAKCFAALTDKEGNMLYRVVMFKPAAEPFKKACREKRYVIRDFEFDADAYKNLCKERQDTSAQVERNTQFVTKLIAAAWSDAIVGMLHVKAMRMFVESVLRYGMPPKFASFLVKPKNGAQVATRRALGEILGTSNLHSGTDGLGDDGEEYFPYVSFSFTPFTVPRA